MDESARPCKIMLNCNLLDRSRTVYEYRIVGESERGGMDLSKGKGRRNGYEGKKKLNKKVIEKEHLDIGRRITREQIRTAKGPRLSSIMSVGLDIPPSLSFFHFKRLRIVGRREKGVEETPFRLSFFRTDYQDLLRRRGESWLRLLRGRVSKGLRRLPHPRLTHWRTRVTSNTYPLIYTTLLVIRRLAAGE